MGLQESYDNRKFLLASLTELCDLARKAVYTWVELENCFGNDLNSIADMRRSVQSQVSWVRGMSMQEVRPLITFCARVIQLLEPGGICMQTCAMAERARGLVRKSLGLCLKDTAPAQIPTAHQYGWANEPVKQVISSTTGKRAPLLRFTTSSRWKNRSAPH